ncbi:MAG TPA: hypothetical protein VMT85_15920 [Thermoanaerobaculia bacterium]|nr:hypothetical protein [Thermoanaerobaculia bacterium]
MTKVAIAGGALLATVLVLFAFAAGHRALEQALQEAGEQEVDRFEASSPAIMSSASAVEAEAHQGFLYGRVTTDEGVTYEGRLRFGGGEEGFWGDYFNGFKDENPWIAHVPPARLKERRTIQILGIEIAHRERQIHLGRPFMARFGDISRIERRGRDLLVTLKSGTLVELDRFAADDFADGVRIWDDRRGVVDLEERRMRTIELLPTARLGAVPDRLHGTVRTRQGDFTGFVQWDREECMGTDELDGRTADGELSVRFDAIRSIARNSTDSSLVTLLDGREVVLSDTNDVGHGNRGLYVDDRRYGRVLISWDAFVRVDFSPDASGGPAYGDFPPGDWLTGSVVTRAGRRLAGRLVYDLDESETTETLDAPWRGVDYTIPFGLVASIVLADREERGAQHAKVSLHSGEELQLERAGDLGARNAGLLVFVDDDERPEHVPWSDVQKVDFDRPPAMYPPPSSEVPVARPLQAGLHLGLRPLRWTASTPRLHGLTLLQPAPRSRWPQPPPSIFSIASSAACVTDQLSRVIAWRNAGTAEAAAGP